MMYAKRIFVIVLLGWGGATAALAQNVGKIKGTVIDSETQQILPGANIVIKGTTKGASADGNGVYNILQVEAGTYDLAASFVGYNKTTVEGVTVKAGLTAEVNIELTPEDLEIGEVTVKADQSMIQQDVANTQETYTREEMEATPGLTSSMDVFQLQGDAVQGGPQLDLEAGGQQVETREGQLEDIHLRGGRGGEILYLVDGLPITHPLYGGRSVLDLDLSDIERIEVTKGAFSAKYGNAQSGVVEIWTRSGRKELQGGMKYETDSGLSFLGESFGRQYINFYLSGLEPLTSKLLPRLGLHALKNDVTFFASANTNFSNTQYDNNRRRETYNLLDGLGSITGKQTNKLSLNGKLTYQPNPLFRAVLSYNGSWRRWSDFDWLWVGRPLPFGASAEERSLANHTAVGGRDTYNLGLHIRHTLSDATYYELQGGYLSTDFQKNLVGFAPSDLWFFGPDTLGRNGGQPVPYENAVRGTQKDAQGTGFYSKDSFENPWRHNTTGRLTLNWDLTSQVFSDHMLRTGADVKLINIDYVDIQGSGTKLSNYGRYLSGVDSVKVDAPPGPYKMFGQNRWVFGASPKKGAVYMEDKFERSSLIITGGVRMDWFMPGSSVFEEDYVNAWCDATELVKSINATNPCTRTGGTNANPEFDVDWMHFRYSISPRFSVSFPVFERTQIFFNYGHTNQLPEFQHYFRDPFSGASFTGNPGLDYEKTIKYEFGFRHQFAENWALDVKTFNRDNSQQIGFTRLKGSSVSVADNKAYGRARGLKLGVENRNRLKTHTSGQMDYTIQWAKGYSSSSFDDYTRSQTDAPKPIRERRLSYDVRHQFIFRGTLKSPDGNPLKLLGLTFPTDWRISTLTTFNSGSPYTPGTIDPVERQLLHNEATGPWRMRVDLKFRKRFDIFDGKIGFYAEVFNLFDQSNVIIRGPWFNEWTGEPSFFGDIDNPTNRIRNYYESYRIRSPRQFSLGRRVQLGLQYDF